MQPYPSVLPCVSRIEGHSATVLAGLGRTLMEDGHTRARRMQRVLPQTLALVFVMPQDLFDDWLAWVNKYAFTDFVALRLPGLAASQAGADVVPMPVRFTSPIACDLIPAHRLWVWRCRVMAEWLPG